MAQFLYDRDSTKIHLNITKRHMHLARQMQGAEEFAATIEPVCKELTEKKAATDLATEVCENKRDLVIFHQSNLADRVRDLMADCNKYDRDHPGKALYTLVFPKGASSIIYAPLEMAPSEADNLILAIQSLGKDHPLCSSVLPLQKAISECRMALDELQTALSAKQTAETMESVAKHNLNRQYAQNIYAAGLKYGKPFFNRLFPIIHSRTKSTGKPEKLPKQAYLIS